MNTLEIYNEHNKYLRSVARKMCHDVDLADDMCQAVWEKVTSAQRNKSASFKGGSDIKTWLVTILKNTYFNHLKLNSSKIEIRCDEIDEKVISREYNKGTFVNPVTPENIVSTDELANNFSKLLNDGSLATMAVYNHYLNNDCDYQEVADLFNIPVGTVRSRIFRAKQELTRMYESPDVPNVSHRSHKKPDSDMQFLLSEQ